jgi:GGDEF domain-containing protein
MRLGTTRHYPSSSGFDACPHLRGRIGGPCSATCVPVRVLGRSIGVLHRTDPVHEPADEAVVATLESLASKSGTRLSIVRAATHTAPAAFDPSTGLLDRASTERHVFDLGRDLTPFSLAQGDIDHFQEYLRVNGREAANLAIRLVARVMQEILRPSDVIGRFGEDEFLVILPQALPPYPGSPFPSAWSSRRSRRRSTTCWWPRTSLCRWPRTSVVTAWSWPTRSSSIPGWKTISEPPLHGGMSAARAPVASSERSGLAR